LFVLFVAIAFYILHFTFYIKAFFSLCSFSVFSASLAKRLFNSLSFDRRSLNNAAQWEPKEVIISINKSPLTFFSLCPSSVFSASLAKRLFNSLSFDRRSFSYE
jgi:hypothetical protein